MADSMQKTEIEDKRSPLEKLSSGLLMQTMHREAKEPEYSVIDRVTFGHVVVQRRSAYVSEIKRVIEELELTLQLISEVNETTTLKVGDNVKYAEELLDYYNGVFLGLVHQLKD
ncbi:MAG TPA: hypothetical protein VGO98_02765, partial [Candidatus Saccharimonadales bacterium]|nr:hypothetical protein [Candidatus Saccharimonadales bacterium]